MITTQRELRRRFWEECGDLPGITRHKITDYSGEGKMYDTTTRTEFVFWVDALNKNGEISDALVDRATL